METIEDWWTGFFTEFFGEHQAAGLFEDKAPAEVETLERLLELAPGERVLDAPCGAGRHSLELARRGKRVLGVDFNPAVIEAARQKAAAAGLEAEFRVEDIRRLQFAGEFDAALCHWGSFGYFDESDNAEFLARIGQSLRPGGRFFLDTLVAESLYPKFRPRDWSFFGEGKARGRLLEERVLDFRRGRVDSAWTFIRDGGERTHSASIRIYTYREIEGLLRAAGFSSFEPHGNAGGEFALGARLWLVARK